MKTEGLNLKSIPTLLGSRLGKLRRYSLIAFIILVAAIYGFVLLRINNLRSVEPTDEAIISQVKAARIPKIDDAVIKQIKSLEDNSVSVHALFDEARSNPFQ